MAPAAVAAEEADPADKPNKRVTRTVDNEAKRDADDLIAWSREWSLAPDFKVRIQRVKPQTYNGEVTAGWLKPDLTERVPDISDWINQQFGGGEYVIQLHVPNGRGGFEYGKQARLTIVGPPKLVGAPTPAAAAPVPSGPDPLAERAFDMTERIAEEARRRADLERERADRERDRAHDVNASTIAHFTRPLEAQNQQLAETNRELQRKLAELMERGPVRDELRDRIIERAVEGESQRVRELEGRYQARIETLEANHASELRQLRQSHADEVKRLEHRADTTVENLRRDYERTLEAMRRDHDRTLADIKSAHERELRSAHETRAFMQSTTAETQAARLDGLKGQISRLEAENGELRAQVAALRAVKEKSPADQLKELAGIKENLDNLTGGGGGEEESTISKILNTVMNADSVVEFARGASRRLAGGEEDDEDEDGGGVQAPAHHPKRKRPQPRQAVTQPKLLDIVINQQDGKHAIHLGHNQYEVGFPSLEAAQGRRQQLLQHLQQRRLQAQQAQQAQQQQPAQAGGEDVIAGLADEPSPAAAPAPAVKMLQPTRTAARAAPAPAAAPAVKPPSKEQLELAVGFLESAVQGKSTPDQVARTAGSLIPGNVLAFIQQTGVDQLLAAIQQHKPHSVLVTQKGRNYVREVGRHLFGQ